MSIDTTPTLYDILGVDPDASGTEIRDAWRDAADRFQPGEGGSTKQFRLFNEAAEVLLDPARRAEYDARLAPGAATGEAEGGRDAVSADAAGVRPDAPMPGAATAAGAAATDQHHATTTTSGAPGAASAPATSGERGGGIGAGLRVRRALTRPVAAVVGVLGAWATVAVALVVAAAVGLAAYFVVQAEQAEQYQEALDRAPAAAENAALAVLSYDHESLEADRDAAAKFLTPGYRSDYVETFDKLVSKSATETKATVEAEVLASSAMTAGSRERPDRVPVLLFVNQTTTSAATSADQPSVALNRVRFDMVQVDGTWLVDGITSY